MSSAARGSLLLTNWSEVVAGGFISLCGSSCVSMVEVETGACKAANGFVYLVGGVFASPNPRRAAPKRRHGDFDEFRVVEVWIVSEEGQHLAVMEIDCLSQAILGKLGVGLWD